MLRLVFLCCSALVRLGSMCRLLLALGLDAVMDVRSWRCTQYRVLRIAFGLRSINQLAGALVRPRHAVIPPAALDLGRGLEPLAWRIRQRGVGVETGLRIARRADNGLDMAAVAQHELAALTQHLRTAIHALPDAEVIVGGAEHVAVDAKVIQ